MTPQHEQAVRQAVEQLAAALLDAVRDEKRPDPGAPERLLSIAEASERLGRLSRSALYEGPIAHGELRTCRVGRRRMVPESAVREYIERAAGGAH